MTTKEEIIALAGLTTSITGRPIRVVRLTVLLDDGG